MNNDYLTRTLFDKLIKLADTGIRALEVYISSKTGESHAYGNIIGIWGYTYGDSIINIYRCTDEKIKEGLYNEEYFYDLFDIDSWWSQDRQSKKYCEKLNEMKSVFEPIECVDVYKVTDRTYWKDNKLISEYSEDEDPYIRDYIRDIFDYDKYMKEVIIPKYSSNQ